MTSGEQLVFLHLCRDQLGRNMPEVKLHEVDQEASIR